MVNIIMSPSASGKDYIQSILIKEHGYEPIISYTTRPMREGETNGVEYNFVGKDVFLDMIENDCLIEYRTYDTLVGGNADTWYYGMVKQEFDKDKNYVVILDVQGAKEFIEYIGEENVKVFYIDCPQSLKTERAIKRGSFDAQEWERRMNTDKIDFSYDKLEEINELTPLITIENFDAIIYDGKFKYVDRNINDVIKEIVE